MLWDHVELLARVHANLNECVALMRTEPFCLRQLVPPGLHVADQGQAASVRICYEHDLLLCGRFVLPGCVPTRAIA
jgi:hypothetical protein